MTLRLLKLTYTKATNVLRLRRQLNQIALNNASYSPVDSEKSSAVAIGGISSPAFHLLKRLETICISHGIQPQVTDVASLAESYPFINPDIKTALASLFPNHTTQVWIEVDADQDNHAEALEALIDATQCELGISEIDSYKDPDTNRVTVRIADHSETHNWTFHEPENRLSGNFVKIALKYVADKAGGQFYRYGEQQGYHHYLFVPDKLQRALLSYKAPQHPKKCHQTSPELMQTIQASDPGDSFGNKTAPLLGEKDRYTSIRN